MSKTKVAIIDYGSGNLASVMRAVTAVGWSSILVRGPEQIQDRHILLLPGVSSFSWAMQKLQQLGLAISIQKRAQAGQPLLGICAGMQLLFDQSTEFGVHGGLKLVRGSIEPLKSIKKAHVKTPNMGWRPLYFPCSRKHFIYAKLCELNLKHVYFAHSYFAKPKCAESILATITHSDTEIPAIISQNNIVGMQFHPEKSGPVGLHLLHNTLSHLEGLLNSMPNQSSISR